MSCNVKENSLNALLDKKIVDSERRILNVLDFKSYNTYATNLARSKYGVTGEGMLYEVIEPKSSLPYDRIIGYNKSSFYDVNDELFAELQEKFDNFRESFILDSRPSSNEFTYQGEIYASAEDAINARSKSDEELIEELVQENKLKRSC